MSTPTILDDFFQELTVNYNGGTPLRTNHPLIQELILSIQNLNDVTPVDEVAFQTVGGTPTHTLTITLLDERLANYDFLITAPVSGAQYSLVIGNGYWNERETLLLPEIRRATLGLLDLAGIVSFIWEKK